MVGELPGRDGFRAVRGYTSGRRRKRCRELAAGRPTRWWAAAAAGADLGGGPCLEAGSVAARGQEDFGRNGDALVDLPGNLKVPPLTVMNGNGREFPAVPGWRRLLAWGSILQTLANPGSGA